LHEVFFDLRGRCSAGVYVSA